MEAGRISRAIVVAVLGGTLLACGEDSDSKDAFCSIRWTERFFSPASFTNESNEERSDLFDSVKPPVDLSSEELRGYRAATEMLTNKLDYVDVPKSDVNAFLAYDAEHCGSREFVLP